MATPPTADSPTPKRHRAPARADRDSARLLRKLTPREAQALAHLAAGHDLPHTAAALGVTPATARSYLQRAMRKLGAPTEAEAVTRAADILAPDTPAEGFPAPDTPAPDTPAPDTPAPDTLAPDAPAADPLPTPPAAIRTNFAGVDPSSLGPAAGRWRAQSAQPTGPERAAPAHTPPAPGRPPGPEAPAGPGRRHAEPDRTAASDDGPAGAPASPAATARRPSVAGHPDAGHAGGVERGDVAARARAATMAQGSQHPPGSGSAQAAPAAPGSTTASGSRQPAGTEGHGTMAQLAPAAPAAGEGPESAPPAPADRPAGSFEELYETAYTRLAQQVFLLTACRHRAVHCVRRAFGEARRGWPAVAGSGDPEGWVRVRACELALSPWHRGGPRRAHAWGLPHRRIKVRPADESQAVLPDHDRLTDRDRALLKALRRLSRPQRRALVLHDGLGLPAAAVAVEVESTLAAAEGRVWTSRVALAQWVPDLVGPDPSAPGFADGLSRLLHRAAVRGCPAPHRSPVPLLRARHRLWTASRTGAAALLTVAVGGAVLATLAGMRPAALFGPPPAPAPSLCLPPAEEDEPAVPLLPGGAPNGITSLWCSPAPGLEAVVVEPHGQAAARWELPPAARGAEAPPPQGPTVCRLWSPLPCSTGPKAR
ncbi:sigma factor-like helix-turn-helix DNA-binding protein [Streptomyces sp. NRRL S-350]|uniref:sigma factor-like helix-turn-helix DNA-binding protein n=1 Tax=Streptomyces sp. NRRL S-350 TaxID=1463902 RepID=UPI0004BF96DF|nr:sigma factor-like helix-turn-helix DNA-binding protein [Streptomyces sp. NRRL S-350]